MVRHLSVVPGSGEPQAASPARERHAHSADVAVELGPFRSRASVRITSGGLLSVGALVSGILLAVAPIIWTATSVARERARRPVEWDH